MTCFSFEVVSQRMLDNMSNMRPAPLQGAFLKFEMLQAPFKITVLGAAHRPDAVLVICVSFASAWDLVNSSFGL